MLAPAPEAVSVDTQIILLPKDNYSDWLEAAQRYALHFGANLTSDPETASRSMHLGHLVSVVVAPHAYAMPDIVAWLRAAHPDLALDVVPATSPEELRLALAARIRSGDRFAPVTPPAPTPRHGLTGSLRLETAKPAYTARDEAIVFIEEITNHTDEWRTYSFLGIKVTKLSGAGHDFFHTSWSGDLRIGPRCRGPKDTCGGEWRDMFKIEQPGTYRLELSICHSPYADAVTGRGEWEILTPGLDIVVVDGEPPV
jgi:hypothetical protein